MASLIESVEINVSASVAWHALRDVGAAHKLFAGVLVDGSIEGEYRTVVFADGMTVKERIVGIDDDNMRLAYTVLGEVFEFHAASMQIVATGPASCIFLWWTDVLPEGATEMVASLMNQGGAAAKRVLEQKEAQ
jgi:hypothetical protein